VSNRFKSIKKLNRKQFYVALPHFSPTPIQSLSILSASSLWFRARFPPRSRLARGWLEGGPCRARTVQVRGMLLSSEVSDRSAACAAALGMIPSKHALEGAETRNATFTETLKGRIVLTRLTVQPG